MKSGFFVLLSASCVQENVVFILSLNLPKKQPRATRHMWKVSTGQKEFDIEWESVKEGTGKLNGEAFSLSVTGSAEGGFHILKGNKSYRADVLKANPKEKTFLVRVNGEKFTLQVKDKFDQLLAEMGLSNMAQKKINEMRSPMPGLVLDIQVKPGDTVKTGDVLLILEAMKMENVLKSPTDGVIKKIAVEKGKAVEKNEILIHFE
jgi:biotin carboxyl carrier protein